MTLALDKSKKYPSLIPLVVANTAPIIGVLFFNWDLFQVMFLYWLESAVIGFYNVFRLIKVSGLLSILFVPFFIAHYGGFMVGHLIFILSLFAPNNIISTSLFPSFSVISVLLIDTIIPLMILMISHGFSFFYNFLGKREYEHINSGKQVNAPYRRIVLMHITLIIGGWLVLIFKMPLYGIVMLILLKIIVDFRAHIKEHTQLQTQ